jgi:hypothetical protein
VIVCLVGGGQEINTGEAGIEEWLNAINKHFPEWRMFVSSRLTDTEYAAGNAYIDHPPTLIWVKGERPIARAPLQPTGRAFQAGGLQVIFALLCHPGKADRPYREIAELAGVAHGTVGWVMTVKPETTTGPSFGRL